MNWSTSSCATWAEAERGIELMRGDLNGRATFLVEQAGESGERIRDLPASVNRIGGAYAAQQCAETDKWPCEPFRSRCCRAIANCYMAADRAVARELAVQVPHCWFLDAGRHQLITASAVSGGKKTRRGPAGAEAGATRSFAARNREKPGNGGRRNSGWRN